MERTWSASCASCAGQTESTRWPSTPSAHCWKGQSAIKFNVSAIDEAHFAFLILLNASPAPAPHSDLSRAYTHGDNSPIVATDSIKNTLNLLAKTLAPQTVLCPELFAMHAATHFVKTYKHISSAQIELIQHRWTRITLQEGKEHPHSFVRDGDEKRTVDVRVEKNSPEEEPFLKYLRGGLKGLLLLKSTGSAFHGFIRDEYTTLPEVHDRIFSTEVECNCECPVSVFISSEIWCS